MERVNDSKKGGQQLTELSSSSSFLPNVAQGLSFFPPETIEVKEWIPDERERESQERFNCSRQSSKNHQKREDPEEKQNPLRLSFLF